MLCRGCDFHKNIITHGTHQTYSVFIIGEVMIKYGFLVLR